METKTSESIGLLILVVQILLIVILIAIIAGMIIDYNVRGKLPWIFLILLIEVIIMYGVYNSPKKDAVIVHEMSAMVTLGFVLIIIAVIIALMYIPDDPAKTQIPVIPVKF